MSMLRPNDDDVASFEVDLWGPEHLAGWNSGWFFWTGYNTPAYVTAWSGGINDVVFKITCRWGDGEYHPMFFLRYSAVSSNAEMFSRAVEDPIAGTEIESTQVEQIEVDPRDLRPDVVLTALSLTFFGMQCMSTAQAAEIAWADWEDAPAPMLVWRPVDLGQGERTVLWATDDALQIESRGT